MREAEKERKIFYSRISSYLTPAKKFQINSKKIQKIKKDHAVNISIQTGMRYAEKAR